METLFNILLIIMTILIPIILIASIYMLDRNKKVYAYRGKVIEWAFAKRNEREVARRVKIYHSVSYDEMMYKFWKSPSSFYPDYEKEIK